MSAFIFILGGIFLVIAIAAVYVLVDKKVISNPLEYISSIFSPNGAGTTGVTLDGTTGGTNEDENGESSEYVDKYSPDKKVKGRYVWITRANANADTYKDAFYGTYRKYPFDTSSPNGDIIMNKLEIYGAKGKLITDTGNEEEEEPTTREEESAIGGKIPVDVYDDSQSGMRGNDIKYTLFRSNQLKLGNGGWDEGTTVLSWYYNRNQNRQNWLKIDLKSRREISEIVINIDFDDQVLNRDGDDMQGTVFSGYERDNSLYRSAAALGLYVIITNDDSMERPVVITPIIKGLGTSHSFSFPGTEWSTDSHDDLKLKVAA